MADNNGEGELKRVFRKIRTRALRSAPIYLEHVSEVQDDVEALLAASNQQAVQKALDELWHNICNIETFIVSIPVNYTPDSHVLRIPMDDERGVAHTVIGVPQGYLEKVFQKAVLAAAQPRVYKDRTIL